MFLSPMQCQWMFFLQTLNGVVSMSIWGRSSLPHLQLLDLMPAVAVLTSRYWKPAGCQSDCQVKANKKNAEVFIPVVK